MAIELELLGPNDKPALLGISTPEILTAVRQVLLDLGYKVHLSTDHTDFTARFAQVQYQVVVTEETFACPTLGENEALGRLQRLSVNLRRHATVILIGPSFQTLHPMHAFQQSVHGVINPADFANLSQIFQKIIADTALFYNLYRETQRMIAQGKA